MNWLGTLRDRMLTADPGFVRLDTAARTTAAVALTTGVLLAIVRHAGGSPVIVLVGAIASWISAIPVNDPALRARRVTTLLVPLPAIAGMAVGTLVAGNPLREDPLFLAIVFGSVYARRYGSRYVTLGVVLVLAYFFSLFVGTSIPQLPSLFGALVAGSAATYATRFVFFPKHAAGSLWSVMQAILAQQRLALARARELEVRERGDAIRTIVREIARINELTLLVEEQGALAGAFHELAFECELAAENALVATVDPSASEPEREAAQRRLGEAIERVRSTLAGQPRDPEESSPQREAIVAEARRPAPMNYRLRPTTIQAIQVTLAAGGAIVVGEHISPERWYWAVLTAFLVFSGTTSSGEAFARAWARTAGTAAGVLAGAVVGSLVQRDVALESALLFFSMLFAAYFLRALYGAASFFITMMVVMLYALTGKFTENVLMLRFVETMAGAFFGVFAATVVLPVSTRRVFRTDVIAVLEALRDGLRAVEASPGEAPPAARRCDAAVRRLRQRIDPLRSGPTFAGFSGLARRWLRALELCAYYLRNAAGAPEAGGEAAAVDEAIACVEDLLRTVAADEAWPRREHVVGELAPPHVGDGRPAGFMAQVRQAMVELGACA